MLAAPTWSCCELQERELAADEMAPAPNAVFDDSGNFVLYPTLLGIKVRAGRMSDGLHFVSACATGNNLAARNHSGMFWAF